jgi:DMSO reductase family type II enzyme heme b subunit
MQVKKVEASSKELLNPAHSAWAQAESEQLPLIATPSALQPTAYLKVAYATKVLPGVNAVDVAAVHNGRDLLFRLEWGDPQQDEAIRDNNQFLDSAGVLFALVPDAVMTSMGEIGKAVNAWFWQAGFKGKGRSVWAEGLGSTETLDEESVSAEASWNAGRWTLVIGRALRVDGDARVMQLNPGDTVKFGVAVWDGAAGERGGVKGFSVDWRELTLAG